MTLIDVNTTPVKISLPTLLLLVLGVAGVTTTAVTAFATKASTSDVDPRFRSLEKSMQSLKVSAREQKQAMVSMQHQLDALLHETMKARNSGG